jgi:Flavin-binding monooxygenase-like
MAFRGFLFPPETPLYPPASTVLAYLQSFASAHDLFPHIRLGATVESAVRVSSKWHVAFSSPSGPSTLQDIDSLIVANGHYSQPYIPPVPGLEGWQVGVQYSHSIHYRSPSAPVDLTGKSVLVVGGGASGVDIAQDLLGHANVVYRSSRSIQSPDDTCSPRLRPGIALVLSSADGAVEFKDGSVLRGMDHIIFATGYTNYYPFLPPEILLQNEPPPCVDNEFLGELYNSGKHVFPLARHLIPLIPRLREDELAFIQLPLRVVPFPLVQAQATILVSIFTSQGPFLDRDLETRLILDRDQAVARRSGGDQATFARIWHMLPGDEQFDYREDMLQLTGLEETEARTPEWQRVVYRRKVELLKAWRAAAGDGRAEELVKGIGTEGGWVELMMKLLDKFDEQTNSCGTKDKGVIPKL